MVLIANNKNFKLSPFSN